MSLETDLDLLLVDAEPKVLTIDIETSPNVVYAWGLWDQNIGTSQVIETSRVLCVAAKWLDHSEVLYFDERGGRKQMLSAVWDLLDEAHIVVGYNHEQFDIPHLQREFLLAGFLPPSPYRTVDLLKTNRRKFKWLSNRLGFVSDELGIGSKLETGGQSLWRDVLAGDEKAWARFRRYNIQDVRLTEQLFEILSPWISLPHRGQWAGRMSVCYSCGGDDLVLLGVVYGKTAAYPKMQCSGCGAWNRVLRNGQTRAA